MMLAEADALGPQCGPFCGLAGGWVELGGVGFRGLGLVGFDLVGFDLVERCYNMGQ